MHSISKITSRYWYRSRLFWLIFLLATYALIGFLILPNIIKNTAIDQIEQNLGWQSNIESVEVNPFALTLTISKLAINDQQNSTVLSFDRFHSNIELRSIIEGAATFSSMELVGPYLKLVIDESGTTNFHKALAENSPAQIPETEAQNSASPPKLLFDSIKVNAGKIDVIDHTQSTPIEHQLTPISFALNNFSTFTNGDGAYQLDVALGTGQHIAWSGNIGIAPFHSSGFLKVEDIRAHRLWAYAQAQVPYTLTHGLIDIEGQYDISMAGSSPQLDVSNAIITLDELKVAPLSSEDSFLDINKISVGPLDFDLAKQKLDISQLAIDTLSLKLERDKRGALTLLAPLSKTDRAETNAASAKSDTETTEADTETATAKTGGKTSQPSEFKWSIGELLISGSQVSLTDLQPQTPAKIDISNINSRLAGLSQDMTKKLEFDLTYFIQDSGKSEITGQLTPNPLNLKAAIDLESLALSVIQPYLNEQVRMTIDKGALSVAGDLALAIPEGSEVVNGGFTGVINIDQFNTTDQSVNERLIGWENLTIEPIKVGFNPFTVEITDIRFEEPYGRVVVTEDRSTNLAQLAVASVDDVKATNTAVAGTKNTPPKKPADESDPEAQKPVPLKIDRILFNNGAAYFADLSIKPPFGTSIQNISGEISGLSADNLERATVDVKGTIEDYGKMLIKGKINPLSGDLYTDLDVKFDNIELSTMTPYSGRYAGYAIDKGKLNLHLNYKIANRMLKGENRLVLDQFELGDTVSSEESVDLPLKLALPILRDRNGVIDIDLPTEGNMDDPDFKISGLVLNAFTNVIIKAATAPFSMISSLVGGSPESLQSVAFEPGKAGLTDEQLSNLAKLSNALKERPQIILEIRANVDEEIDGGVIKKTKLDKRLNISNNLSRIEQLEKLVIARAGQQALDNAKASTQTQTATDSQSYEKALYDIALKTEPVSNLELNALAKRRISSIKTALIEQNGVAKGQVFALKPSLAGETREGKVVTSFNLTAR
ncbi:DUF748 domain-containing protein [Alkalimarinus coralli]|uniref:DUF748 domain-containing protein n=1 Tax=Alkalimarinus coralli TaxID=2935863 RepID=UPI00202B3BDA|nr:DUF748 domain-containing protein [Alkalimarinus coralli]